MASIGRGAASGCTSSTPHRAPQQPLCDGRTCLAALRRGSTRGAARARAAPPPVRAPARRSAHPARERALTAARCARVRAERRRPRASESAFLERGRIFPSARGGHCACRSPPRLASPGEPQTGQGRSMRAPVKRVIRSSPRRGRRGAATPPSPSNSREALKLLHPLQRTARGAASERRATPACPAPRTSLQAR